MGKTYIKTIIREIKQSFGRFFAIFAIVALGVGFLAGLLVSTPNMKESVDQYYEQNNMTDIFIKSNLGLTKDDFKEISKIKEVEHIMPAYVTDSLMKKNDTEVLTTRIYGLPLETLKAKDSQFINRLELVKGRMPRSSNECVVETSGVYLAEIEIGETLTIYEEDEEKEDEIEDTYETTKYTVVGIVSNPFYFSTEREPSSKGDGRVGAIVYVSEDSYALDVYTDFYIRVLGTGLLPSFTDGYEIYVEDVVKGIEKIGKVRSRIRYKEVIEEANDKLNDAKDDYKEAKKEAYQQLEDALKEIQSSQVNIIAAESELLDARMKLSNSDFELSKEKSDYQNKMSTQEAEFRRAETELYNARQSLINAQTMIGIDAYNRGMSDLLIKESEILSGKLLLEMKKSEAEDKFADAQVQIEKARQDIDQGEKELKQAKQEIATAEVTYRQAKEDTEKELDDADFKITEAEEDIEDIKDAKWYVLDRNSNVSYASFSANVEKVGAIAKVFPIFFLLVAALVALTTMTRMVEEGRTQIGTLKALGYTNGVIMAKYIIYCGIASFLGSIFGLMAGFKILPAVIWSAYGTMYSLPSLISRFDWTLALILSSLAITSTMVATISACYNALKEKPATLMLPRAPKAGKRIFLENITFIWSRMKFTYKATARNLIRYKKHFCMTVIGISGCTALIVAGFGLRDSIGDIANTQFDEIFKYDLIIEKDDIKKSDKILEDFLSNKDRVQGYIEVLSEDGSAQIGRESFDTSIIVPKESTKLKKFINLRDRRSGKPITFNDSSVILSEKLADALDIKIGDTFTLKNSDDVTAKFVLTGITENYVGSYAYINRASYIKAFGEDFSYDTLMVKTYITESSKQDQALVEILAGDTILNAEFASQTKESYDNLLGSISFVVIVLILAAGGLAIIVLYNLTNINIDERRKELATLKVLGFHDTEVAAYIYRETTILSIIGTGVGLFIGAILHSFIIKTGETVDLMFGRTISMTSFALSALVTLLFSVIVELIMYKKLKNIEMVDSMKAID